MQVETVFIVKDERNPYGEEIIVPFKTKESANGFAYNLESDTQDYEENEDGNLYFARITFYSGRVVTINERIMR